MSSFLARYENGEHEQVWAEFTALGAAVRTEPLYSDALAVARETMRRVRRNIEMLIPRLVAVGYQFGYGWVQPYVRDWLLRPHHIAYPGRFGELMQPSIPESYTLADRLAYEDALERAGYDPPLFVPANDRDERIVNLEQGIANTAPSQEVLRNQLRAMQAELRAKPSAKDLVAELESLVGPLPFSVRAWYEEVGAVNFVGDHPGWRELLPESREDYPTDPHDYVNPMHALRPLWVWALDERQIAKYRSAAQSNEAWHELTLWPIERSKYLDPHGRDSGRIAIPHAEMDAPLRPSGPLFIAYLRLRFRWAGFPGWSELERRPEADLAFLTERLISF